MGTPTASGLDDVVAAETLLSDVDGQAGRLIIRGHSVEELVDQSTFEDVVGLMWNGELPSKADRETIRAQLARGREEAFKLVSSLCGALNAPDGLESVRASVGHIWAKGDAGEDRVRLTGAIPVLAAAWHRTRAGSSPIPPQTKLGHAADFLQMLSGKPPQPAHV